MKDLIQKIEEQIIFLQYEISKMSDEIYNHQKDILILKKELSESKNKIIQLENNIKTNILKEEDKPPHY